MNRGILLRPIERRWECPNCDQTAITRESRPHTEFHHCPKLGGFAAPMVPAGTKAKVEAIERLDYIAGELVQTNDDGRPIMSVVTTRDDGQDCAVYPASARIDANAERGKAWTTRQS